MNNSGCLRRGKRQRQDNRRRLNTSVHNRRRISRGFYNSKFRIVLVSTSPMIKIDKFA